MKKRNKILIIISIVFVVVATVFLILGFALAGNDILALLGSKYAMLFYIAFGTYGLIVLFVLISDRIKRLWTRIQTPKK